MNRSIGLHPSRLSLIPLAAAVLGLVFTSCSSAPKGPMKGSTKLRGAEDYPIPWCPVDGKGVTKANSIRRAYKGQEVRFCSEGCQKQFEADPATYWFF